MPTYRIIALFIGVSIHCQLTHAIAIDVKADFFFGPDISRNQACANAREAAKIKAISAVTGERLAFDQRMYCAQNAALADDKRCEMNRHTWTLVEGRISKSEVVSEVVKTVQGAQVCTVSMVVDVEPPTTAADAGFDLKLELNHHSFRPGDALSISILPTSPMYVSVFNWRTSSVKDGVLLLYPNEIDKNNYVTQPITVPSSHALAGYKLELEWTAAGDYGRDLITEWIIVVATKKPMVWLPVYDMARFKEKLLEIPADQRRVVHRSYVLMR
jgi:hypothetical protein